MFAIVAFDCFCKKSISVQVKISNVVSWSDSKVALWWVKSVTKKWKIWVENRVSEIRENVGVDCCGYVPTDCNSAYVATRYNKKLKFEEVLWWKGPSFLCEEEEMWPRSELSSDCVNALDLNQEMGKYYLRQHFCQYQLKEIFVVLLVVRGVVV